MTQMKKKLCTLYECMNQKWFVKFCARKFTQGNTPQLSRQVAVKYITKEQSTLYNIGNTAIYSKYLNQVLKIICFIFFR